MPSSGRSRSSSRPRPRRRFWRPSFFSRSRSARPRTGVQRENAQGASDQPYHRRGFNSLRRHLRLPRHRSGAGQPAGEGADQIRRQRRPRQRPSLDLGRADTRPTHHPTADIFTQLSRSDLEAIQRRGPLSTQETSPSDPIYQTGRLLNPRRHWPFNLRRVGTRAPDRPNTDTFPQLSSSDLEAIRRGGARSSQENRLTDPIYQRRRLSNPRQAENSSKSSAPPPPPGHLRNLKIFSARTPDLPLLHAPANSDGQGSQTRTLEISLKHLNSPATEPPAESVPSSTSDGENHSYDEDAERDSDYIRQNTREQREAALLAALRRRRISLQIKIAKVQERMLEEARENLHSERLRQMSRTMRAMERQEKKLQRRLRAHRRRQRWAGTRIGRRLSTISDSYNAFRQKQQEKRLFSRYFKMVDAEIQESRQRERSEIVEAKERRQDWTRCERNARRKELAKRLKESRPGKAFEKFRGKLFKKPSTESQAVSDVVRRSDLGETAAPRAGQNIQASQQPIQPGADHQSPLETQQDVARRSDKDGSSKRSSSSVSDSSDHQPPHDDGPPSSPSGRTSSSEGSLESNTGNG